MNFSFFRLLIVSQLFFVSFVQPATAQQNFTLSGYVKDAANGESLLGASVSVKNSPTGTSANSYGFFSLNVPAGKTVFSFSYLGYNSMDTALDMNQDRMIEVELVKTSNQLSGVSVQSKAKDDNVKSTDMGKVELSIDQIKTIPAFFGEVDVLKTIQLLPGVQGGGEGNSGFYVRGGGADQNLILLDEAPVYNSGHLFGFFSVFNGDAILNSTLYKGGMPANYGGRISSVIDISMKEGNDKKISGSGGIGLIASRLTLEGPLKKNKSSFIISGRRTYIDIVTKPIVNNLKNSADLKGSGYYFYDLNAKVNYRFSDKNRLYLSGYFGRDVFSFKNNDFNISIPWGNATATLRWNHVFNPKLFFNASAIYNSYHFQTTATQANFTIDLFSGIQDYSTKYDFDYYLNQHHHIRFGALLTYHIFTPSTFSGQEDSVEFNPNGLIHRYGLETALYAMDTWDITDKLQVNAGLRLTSFTQLGPYRKNTYDFTGNLTDSLIFKQGQIVKTYAGLEPRILLRYSLGKTNSLKAAFNVNNQYVHLVSNNGTTLPTDIWMPSTLLVKPQQGLQYSLGYYQNLKKNMFETSVEVYYKSMLHQIEYKEGYTPSPNENLEENFVFGKGSSYGVEFFINKKEGKLQGWISYTLAYTNRTFPDLNGGKPFPYRYDRRHNISVVGIYKFNEHWNLAATFVYYTGIAFTMPQGKYLIEGGLETEYTSLNGFRLPDYNRGDIGLNYDGKKHKHFQSGWSFDIYNVYNRHNAFFIYNTQIGQIFQDPYIIEQAKQVSLFPVLPSVTWNFKF